MRHTKSPGRSGRARRGLSGTLHRVLTRFARDEDGVMLFLVMFLLLIMLITGGMGVDFMRHEMVRAQIQQTLDRAILAAADLDQHLSPKAVVEDYFAKAGMDNYLTSVEVDEGPAYRIVTASASTQMKTQFLGRIGFDKITVPAFGRAEESLGDAEVSLVVDISGSMRDNSKMKNMHDAAEEFIDTVILDGSPGTVSLSVVPYTSQVNAGAAIMDRLNVTRLHGYSNCIVFSDSDFEKTGISTTQSFVQMPHFELYWEEGNTTGKVSNPSCPRQDYEQIIPLSQNATFLKQQIKKMKPRANTSIHIGMKWGTALVDPDIRPAITDMVNNGLIDAAFAGRPTNYEDGALKSVILMTDGQNVDTYNITDKAYATPSMRYHWEKNALVPWLEDHVEDGKWGDFYYKSSTWQHANDMLYKVCDAAKAKGIIVWTVGFEVTTEANNVLKKCASSESHALRPSGTAITDAFVSIARQLNRLKLTQ